MPSRPKRSPPLVTISREAWRELADACAAKDVERWGFLCGCRTCEHPVCFRVMKMIPLPARRQTSSSAVRDLKTARELEQRYRASASKGIPVGSWHSHIWDTRCAAAILSQLSLADKQAMSDDTFCMICSTYPQPEDLMRVKNQFSIHRTARDKVVRAEVWLRVKGRFKPCEIKVR